MIDLDFPELSLSLSVSLCVRGREGGCKCVHMQESLLLAHAHVSETSSISTPSGQQSDELRMCVIGDGGNATSAGAPGTLETS